MPAVSAVSWLALYPRAETSSELKKTRMFFCTKKRAWITLRFAIRESSPQKRTGPDSCFRFLRTVLLSKSFLQPRFLFQKSRLFLKAISANENTGWRAKWAWVFCQRFRFLFEQTLDALGLKFHARPYRKQS